MRPVGSFSVRLGLRLELKFFPSYLILQWVVSFSTGEVSLVDTTQLWCVQFIVHWTEQLCSM